MQGNELISASDIEEKLATSQTPKFLGLFRGILYDYELFDRATLQRDLERVERYYRARGYYDAKVRAGRVHYRNDRHVEVQIEVEEGPPVLVREVQVDGLAGLAPGDIKAAREDLRQFVRTGKPFEEDPFLKAQRAMKLALVNRGYAWAKVERRADVDLMGHFANLFFTVNPGPKATFGDIRIEGLGALPEAPVRRALDIAPHDPYSQNALNSAQQAVIGLGTFGSVEITPTLPEPPPPDALVPLVVRVQPQKLKAVLLGGGIELDAIETEAHLHAGWEHLNLFGGFRHLKVDFKPGGVLFPTRLPDFQKPTDVLPEERFRVELRQPGFLEARTTGLTSHEFNAYPVLLSPTVDPKAPVLGYVEYKGAVGLDRNLWKKLFGAVTYNFQWNKPFAYEGELDPSLRRIIISYVDLLQTLDWRDDKLKPHKGVYVQNDLQFAGIGGDARDFRIQPEVRAYVPVTKKVTFAARATVGFLFPMNYGSTLKDATSSDPGSPNLADWVRDVEIIYLRGFFSGGPSSNRGYPLRGVGPQGAVPFFNPQLAAQALAASCQVSTPTNPNPLYDPVRCAVPIGGLSLWESSVELRFPVLGPFGATLFCDASDVSQNRVTIRLDYPHLSCGIGLRYDTPVGPIRVDLGYRLPGLQVPKGVNPLTDGEPGTIFGIPVAVALGIGEAF